MKEPFYFGGSRRFQFNLDQLSLHGPDPRPPRLGGLPPLWLWEEPLATAQRWNRWADQRSMPSNVSRAKAAQAARHGERVERITLMCAASSNRAAIWSAPHSRNGATQDSIRCSRHGLGRFRDVVPGLRNLTPPARACVHPGCVRIARAVKASWSDTCKWLLTDTWQEQLRELGTTVKQSEDRADAYCLSSSLPWAMHNEVNASIADLTPNYLCDADAMRRIYESAAEPSKLRFIVLLRDPMVRALSEWALFRYKWFWETRSFGQAMHATAEQLEKCNATLFGENVARLSSLPTDEIATYMRSCYRVGQAMAYFHTSTYAVCILHALRYFSPSQFLFLRTDELMSMDARTVVRRIADFAGLHAIIDQVPTPGDRGLPQKTTTEIHSACSPLHHRVMAATMHAADASESLANATPWLTDRFAPYNALLVSLLGSRFFWRPSDQKVEPLSGAVRERVEAQARSRLAKHQVRVRQARHDGVG